MLWRISSRYSPLELRLMSNPGHPTIYKSEYSELAHNYCLLGATNEQLGTFLGVTRQTIYNWIEAHPDFAKSVAEGRHLADARVARSLYTRALGITQKVERTTKSSNGETKTVTNTLYYPPDSQACIFWLRNRSRCTWRDRADAPEAAPEVDEIAILDAAGESVAP